MNPARPHAREILASGLWHNNAGFVQLLGLCPLLAVSNSLINGLALGLATTLTLLASNLTVSLARPLLRPEIRIPLFVLVIASVVTSIELLMQAFLHDLYLVLGIFIPLIVTNCAIIGRAEAFASRQDPGRAALDGLATGLGFALALVALGGLRELLGQGTLLAQAHMLFGDWARGLVLVVIPEYRGLLLALLPPGAFILLGLLVALRNAIDARVRQPARQPVAPAEPTPAEVSQA